MTLGSRDYPDWNRPLTRVASVVVEELGGDVPAGGGVFGSYNANQIDDVLVFYGGLPDGISLQVTALLPGLSANIGTRYAVGVGNGGFIVMPVQTFGQSVEWSVQNNTVSDSGYELTVVAFSGANVDTLVAQGFVFQGADQAVAGVSDSDLYYVSQGFLADRLTLTVECDQPATVTLRRVAAPVGGSPSLFAFDEVIATLTADTATTIDVPLGCAGSAFFLSNAGVTDGTFAYIGRAYRSVGN